MAEAGTQSQIELQLKTGEVIKAPSYEEALKIAVKMVEDNKEYARGLKDKSEALEQRMAAIEAKAAADARPKPVEGQFNKDEYYKRLNDDPISAQNYLDSYRFGIPDPNAVPTTFQQMQRDISVTRQEAMAAQFVQQHAKDFPQTPEAARDLRTRFEAYLADGYPATIETLNLAYGRAVSEGTIKPLEEKEQEREEPPNPNLSGGGAAGITDSEMAKIDQMSDAELEKYMKSKGLI